jgi:hypothetical protein
MRSSLETEGKRRMRNYSRSLSLPFVLILTFLTSVPVSAGTTSDEAMIDELMELSGLTQQIPRLPQAYMTFVDQLLVGLERKRYPVSKSLQWHIRQSFVHALTPERLELEIRSRLLSGLAHDTTLATLTWLQSELGKKITAVELNASSAEKSVELATFVLQLQLERPAPERMQLVRRVEEITQGSELATEAWEAVVATVARAIEAEFAIKDPQRREKLLEYLASERASIKGLFQQGRLLQVLFTYRSLTDEELKRYVEFLEAPTGRDVTRVVNGALQEAAITAIKNIQPDKSVKPKGETA